MTLPSTSRQYYYTKLGSYQNLAQRQVPVTPPKDSQVLVKIHAVSLQYRDLLIARNQYPLGDLVDELVPCSDGAGEIIAVGKDVKGWKVGDRVAGNFFEDFIAGEAEPAFYESGLGGGVNGVLTQYRAYKPETLVAIPDHLSYEEASTLPCAALTAYNALANGPVKVKAGDTVLVQGTGGVSIFGLQFAVASGATVIATSSSDEKLKLPKKLGAKHLINYNKTPNWHEEVLKITNGRGVDHLIEVGGKDTLERALKSTRVGGSIHIIGLLSSTGPVDVIPYAISRSLIIRGLYVGSASLFKDMNRLISAHPDSTRPVIDKVFDFDQVLEAYKHLDSQSHVGKVVIKITH